MDLKETYNRIAEDWHRDHSNDDWWVDGTDTFIKNLLAGGSVLDVGCGGGTKSKYLHERGLKVTGIDISDKLLVIAHRECSGCIFKEFSMSNLDALDETFDGVFAQASLLHIPKKDAQEVVAKMARKVAKGGCLYLAVKEMREGKPEEEIKIENDYGYDYERFFSYFSITELETYLKEAGLEVIWEERKPVGRTAWLQIIGKR